MIRQLFDDFDLAINTHHNENLCALMAEDHAFADLQGNQTVGRNQMRTGWIGYFQLFPDFKIEITDVFIHESTLAAFGYAGGTFQGSAGHKHNSWRLPAAWKAIIGNGKIQLWQVYVDAKIPYDIVMQNKEQEHPGC